MWIKAIGVFLCVLTSVWLQYYLASHYYPLHYGSEASPSVCNVNSTFNCDAVAASPYASVGGIPVAAFGLVANGMLLLLLVINLIGLVQDPQRAWRIAWYFSSLIFAASIVMGSISLVAMSVYCLFCITLYILSAIQWALLYWLQEEPPLPQITNDIKYFASFAGIWRTGVFVALLFGLSTLFHLTSLAQYGGEELDAVIADSTSKWHQSPVFKFEAAPSLVKGADKATAKVTIVEFADFLCPHCKLAVPAMDSFVETRKDVRFEFYNYPLDGNCNPSVDHKSLEVRCWLAAAVNCAGKDAQATGDWKRGWELHHKFFSQQETMGAVTTKDQFQAELNKLLPPEDAKKIGACTFSPEAMDAIKAQAAAGKDAKVVGTPAVFLNGKLLRAGQFMPVLEQVYAEAKR